MGLMMRQNACDTNWGCSTAQILERRQRSLGVRCSSSSGMQSGELRWPHDCDKSGKASTRGIEKRVSAVRSKELSRNFEPHGEEMASGNVDRRQFLALIGLLGLSIKVNPALAFDSAPPGFRLYRDKIDGYSFLLPETWTPLSSSGNDIFFRNPFNVNENLFVNVSSPSSSKYTSVDDLKSPEKAADQTKQQYTRELMSTRIGVKRNTDVISAKERIGADSKKYYDLELTARSYGSRNQLAVSQKEINAGVELEWERHYITVLGVANKRLYEFRLQTSKDTYEKAKENLLYIAQSFKCIDQEE